MTPPIKLYRLDGKIRSALFFEPVYGTNIFFTWGCSLDQLKKFQRARFQAATPCDDVTSLGLCTEFVNDKHGTHCISVYHKESRLKRDAVYHEALHAAFYVLGFRGVKVDPNNHESLTYLQGFIAEKCYEAFQKAKTHKCR